MPACEWSDVGLTAQEPSAGVTVMSPVRKQAQEAQLPVQVSGGLGGLRGRAVRPAWSRVACALSSSLSPRSAVASPPFAGPKLVLCRQLQSSAGPRPFSRCLGPGPTLSCTHEPTGPAQESGGRCFLSWDLVQHPREGERGGGGPQAWPPCSSFHYPELPQGPGLSMGRPETIVRVFARASLY